MHIVVAISDSHSIFYSIFKRLVQQVSCYSVKLIQLLALILFVYNLSLINSYAALHATTAKAIQGTAPYLTFDGGVTKAKSTDDLFTIKLSNNQVIKSVNDTSSSSAPLAFAKPTDRFSDITALITANGTSVAMSTLIVTKFGDDEGDKLHPTNAATGSLMAKWEDNEGNQVTDLSSQPNICNAPYKLTLTATASTIRTQYGFPASSSYNAGSHSYYFQPNGAYPTVCFATPSLNNGTGAYAGPVTQWDSEKGFKVQDLLTASKNFPTMGADGLTFDLALGGVDATSATWKVESVPSSSVVSLGITAQGQSKVSVTLTGPNEMNRTLGFEPTTFKIKANGIEVYTFTLKNWFIPRAMNVSFTAANTYCSMLKGYRIPSRYELSESKTEGGNYTRTIGNGLFGEWGRMDSYSTTSAWISNFYWVSEAKGANQYNVHSQTGSVRVDAPSTPRYRAACVTP